MSTSAMENARWKLRRLVKERNGGDGTLRDVEVCVCEDGRDVLVFANYSLDDPPRAGFRLSRRTRMDGFDDRPYKTYFEEPFH